MQEPLDWCWGADLWGIRMKKPLFLWEISTGLQQCHFFFLCLHEVLQSEHKISSFTSTMHRGSPNVNGNPSWGLNTTWEWKIRADLRAKFSSCNFKGCLLQDAQENVWWMPSAVFLHTAHSERTSVFHCLGLLSSRTPKESLVTTPACTVQHAVWSCTVLGNLLCSP